MKYWNALDAVDTQVVRLSEMQKLLTVIVNGMEQSSPDEVISAVHYVSGSIDDISEQLSESFQILHSALMSEKEK
jgi:hypothetical protein